MSFQNSPPGVPPTEIVASRPQGNNDSNDFIKDMEVSAVSASRSGQGRFVNFSVDGVLVESRHVWSALCDFLSCKSNHTGPTDANHNMKSWRYQVISGGGTVGNTIEMYVIDADLLRLAGVSINLWRPSDFSSDLLVLKLVSMDTIQRLNDASNPFGSTASGDKGVLALSLFFLRLRLHAVNGKSLPVRHRFVYLWCSMLYLTSIRGASIITKRNILAETISSIFIVICSDIPNP